MRLGKYNDVDAPDIHLLLVDDLDDDPEHEKHRYDCRFLLIADSRIQS